MPTDTEMGLAITVTISNVWTQLVDSSTLAVYNVVSGGSAIVASLRALNLGANDATVEFAMGLDATIANSERIIPPITLKPNEMFLEPPGAGREVMNAAEGLWARAVGTSPAVTFRAALLERSPV